LSLRPAHHKKTPQDPLDDGAFVAKPPKAELEKLAKTMDSRQIADYYGTAPRRVRDWLYRSSLRALPQKIGSHAGDLLYRKFEGNVDSIRHYLASTEFSAAQCELDAAEGTLRRMERKYDQRFKRICKSCDGVFAYTDMHMIPKGCSDFCKTCAENPRRIHKPVKRWKYEHWSRVSAEFESVPLSTLTVRLSAAQGINGFWLVQGAGHASHRED
jgi:hypothetical protein